MTTLPQKPPGNRNANCPETKSGPPGHASWIAVLLFHLTLSALLLGPLPCLRAQTSGPEEYTFTTLTGPPEAGPGAVDGPGSAARFYYPGGVALDSGGSVYVADTWNHTIRKVTPDGVVTTLAGRAESVGSADGQGGAARFNSPSGVAADSAGNVYVADGYTIRKVTASGVVTTLAGLADSRGSADGTGSTARFAPSGVAVDSVGSVYVADRGNHTIRKVTASGVVTTMAGLAESWGSADGTGSAARFNAPWDVAVDSGGNVFVADEQNLTIRKVTPDGVVTTLAGLAGSDGSADGTGSLARFGGFIGITGVTVDNAGKVYAADHWNSTIRIGTVACEDQPTIDLAVAPVGLMRQLDTRPQTAVAWQWSLIRQPAGSTAALSDPNVRNPTFTPDVADLYVFRLKATNAVGAVCIRTLELTAVPANVAVLAWPQRLPDGSFQLTLIGQTNQSYILQVSSDLNTWTDWTNVTPTRLTTPLTDPDAVQYPHRFYRLKTPPLGKKWLTVAAVTMTSQTNTEANLQTFFSYMDQAASAGADLVVFPEVALQGCPPWAEYRRLPTEAEMTYVRETAETVPGPSTDRLVAKARELGIHVVFGMTEKDEAGKLYNAAVFLGPAGVIGTHHKSILIYANDNLIWSPGIGFQVFDSPLGRIGLIICAEMGGETGSPETFPGPRLAALGADLLVTASAWWTSIASNYDRVTVDNARMAARWHVIAQQVGPVGYTQCYGHSRVVDPKGRVLCDTGANEGMAIWTTDILTDTQTP